ncbi:MerR family transcriptional regulator [Agromyces archimandritae]|uniref:MerR family transcriptional regulator n=1 Tax=Agromyces archimandritae TaxID=2781962 RepID=A0A975INU5_9MICO|nr:MerR family transcriptional regulator [Agromyces archimandritae]QTX04925.1 MerR family transcriptional regulator [Agromyces archimandritae]
MPQTAARATGQLSLLSIGQVLARLQPEFPELTPSKLRFLEEQGLISPARSESGYRKFSTADVERITFILSMQRDHYLPLKVIRAHLDALDAGDTPALPGATTAPAPRRLHRDQLIEEAGASPALLDDAVAASVIPAGEHYGEEALAMLRALVGLRSVGIEPRHLRGLRSAAEREATLIQNAIAPMSRRNDAADQARTAERALGLAGHIEVIHAGLLRSALGRRAR